MDQLEERVAQAEVGWWCTLCGRIDGYRDGLSIVSWLVTVGDEWMLCHVLCFFVGGDAACFMMVLTLWRFRCSVSILLSWRSSGSGIGVRYVPFECGATGIACRALYF